MPSEDTKTRRHRQEPSRLTDWQAYQIGQRGHWEYPPDAPVITLHYDVMPVIAAQLTPVQNGMAVCLLRPCLHAVAVRATQEAIDRALRYGGIPVRCRFCLNEGAN